MAGTTRPDPAAEIRRRWENEARELLVGRTIRNVHYMAAADVAAQCWDRAALMIELEDGTRIWPSQDEEGNGPGALFTSSDKTPILPVI